MSLLTVSVYQLLESSHVCGQISKTCVCLLLSIGISLTKMLLICDGNTLSELPSWCARSPTKTTMWDLTVLPATAGEHDAAQQRLPFAAPSLRPVPDAAGPGQPVSPYTAQHRPAPPEVVHADAIMLSPAPRQLATPPDTASADTAPGTCVSAGMTGSLAQQQAGSTEPATPPPDADQLHHHQQPDAPAQAPPAAGDLGHGAAVQRSPAVPATEAASTREAAPGSSAAQEARACSSADEVAAETDVVARVAQGSASAAASPSPPSAEPLLQVEQVVVRGQDIRLSTRLGDVVAGLPVSVMRGSTVPVLLILWSGQRCSHRWLVNLRPEYCNGASRWVIPAAEWSNDVLLVPGGHSLFPCGIGRLCLTVSCAPQPQLRSRSCPSPLSCLRLLLSRNVCRLISHDDMWRRRCLLHCIVSCMHRLSGSCFTKAGPASMAGTCTQFSSYRCGVMSREPTKCSDVLGLRLRSPVKRNVWKVTAMPPTVRDLGAARQQVTAAAPPLTAQPRIAAEAYNLAPSYGNWYVPARLDAARHRLMPPSTSQQTPSHCGTASAGPALQETSKETAAPQCQAASHAQHTEQLDLSGAARVLSAQRPVVAAARQESAADPAQADLPPAAPESPDAQVAKAWAAAGQLAAAGPALPAYQPLGNAPAATPPMAVQQQPAPRGVTAAGDSFPLGPASSAQLAVAASQQTLLPEPVQFVLDHAAATVAMDAQGQAQVLAPADPATMLSSLPAEETLLAAAGIYIVAATADVIDLISDSDDDDGPAATAAHASSGREAANAAAPSVSAPNAGLHAEEPHGSVVPADAQQATPPLLEEEAGPQPVPQSPPPEGWRKVVLGRPVIGRDGSALPVRGGAKAVLMAQEGRDLAVPTTLTEAAEADAPSWLPLTMLFRRPGAAMAVPAFLRLWRRPQPLGSRAGVSCYCIVAQDVHELLKLSNERDSFGLHLRFTARCTLCKSFALPRPCSKPYSCPCHPRP